MRLILFAESIWFAEKLLCLDKTYLVRELTTLVEVLLLLDGVFEENLQGRSPNGQIQKTSSGNTGTSNRQIQNISLCNINTDDVEKFAEASKNVRWKYRDKGSMVEVTTPGLFLEIDKTQGSIRFLTKDRKVLCEERKAEPRLIEADKSWQFFDWKKEKIVIPNRGNSLGFSMKGSARYIHGKEGEPLPMLISDRGYCIEILSEGAVLCCDISSYGSYFQVSGTGIDYQISKCKEG